MVECAPWRIRPEDPTGGSFRRARPQPGFRALGPGSLRALGRLGPSFPSALMRKRLGGRALRKPLGRGAQRATISARARPCAWDQHMRPLDPLPPGN